MVYVGMASIVVASIVMVYIVCIVMAYRFKHGVLVGLFEVCHLRLDSRRRTFIGYPAWLYLWQLCDLHRRLGEAGIRTDDALGAAVDVVQVDARRLHLVVIVHRRIHQRLHPRDGVRVRRPSAGGLCSYLFLFCGSPRSRNPV